MIDTSITRVPAPSDQNEPAIAFDGENFLVVWQDSRNSGYCDIHGARVTPTGVVLDSAGIAISTAAMSQFTPSVAFGGGSFLVAWDDPYAPGVYAARVASDGTLLDSAGIRLSARSSPSDVAFDGENFLVVYASGSDIHGTRITTEGVLLDPGGFVISSADSTQRKPAVVFAGSHYLVVWEDLGSEHYDLYGARVTPEGEVLDPAGIPISVGAGRQCEPAVAVAGDLCLVVWSVGLDAIYGARVTTAGEVLDTAGLAISTGHPWQEVPEVTSDGADFLVVWQDRRNGYDVYGARVTPEGEVLDPTGIAVTTADHGQFSPAVAFDGSNFLAIWHDERSSWSYDVYGARVTPGGVVLDSVGHVITIAAHGGKEPAVASDGTNFLAVWEDWRAGDARDIYGARVSATGSVLDATAIAISTGLNREWLPAAAFGDANFLVVWSDGRGDSSYDIYGARVTTAGEVLDPTGIPIAVSPGHELDPAVAFDGENYLVVWCNYRSRGSDICGARVTQSGKVLDTAGITISTAAEYQQVPTLAFDGQNFLVVWSDTRSFYNEVYAARLTPAGEVLDTAGIAISTGDGEEFFPATVYDGANFLVVWEVSHGGGVHAARVTSAGAVLDTGGIAISNTVADNTLPALAFDGENSLVVWHDGYGGSDVRLTGARVKPDGTVFDKGMVTSQQGNQSFAALARGAGSQVLLVYQGWAGVVGDKTYGADRIWGKVNPSPAVAETTKPEVRVTNRRATIVRGVLKLEKNPSTSYLLDVSGRKVLELRPGANDVRALAPGVYFIREQESRGPGFEDSSVTRVVVTR